jgi:ParB family chromosome partitioning protein
MKKAPNATMTEIPTDKLVEPKVDMRTALTRTDVSDLMESINQIGLLNPVLVKKVKDGFEVLAGARRFRACRRLGWKKIPCIVFPEAGLGGEIAKMHENQVRREISPLEEAEFLALLQTEYKLNGKQLAKKIARAESYVSERLALLNAPEELRAAIAKGDVSFSAARELMRIRDESVRASWINHAITMGINDTTAKQWRMDANAATDRGAVSDEPPAPGEKTKPVSMKVECALTGKVVAIEHTLLIRVAKSAWESLIEDLNAKV